MSVGAGTLSTNQEDGVMFAFVLLRALSGQQQVRVRNANGHRSGDVGGVGGVGGVYAGEGVREGEVSDSLMGRVRWGSGSWCREGGGMGVWSGRGGWCACVDGGVGG